MNIIIKMKKKEKNKFKKYYFDTKIRGDEQMYRHAILFEILKRGFLNPLFYFF